MNKKLLYGLLGLLFLLAAADVGLIGYMLQAQPQGHWTVVAACIQALATIALVGVTAWYAGSVKKQAKAAKRSAEAAQKSAEATNRSAAATERSVSFLAQDQKVKRLAALRELKELAEGFQTRSDKRTSDTGKPSDLIYEDDEIGDLEQHLPLVGAEVSRATADAIDAAKHVQDTARALKDAGSAKEDAARTRYEEANRIAAKQFEKVVEEAEAEIDLIKYGEAFPDH